MTAYVDESIRLDGSTGLYVLAAVVVPADRADEVRSALRDAVPTRMRRYHWRKERDPSRAAMCRLVADLDVDAFVTTAPVDPAQQERARRRCLIHLLWVLDRNGVRDVVFETRRRVRDAEDDEIARHAVHAGWVDADFRWTFAAPDEPLLWLPDVVACVVRAEADGNRAWLDALRNRVVIGAVP